MGLHIDFAVLSFRHDFAFLVCNVCMYVYIGTVLRKVSALIQVPLSSFINKILLESGGGDEEGNAALTELEEHVYLVIFELHKISPTLLSRIIPTICQQMVRNGHQLCIQ